MVDFIFDPDEYKKGVRQTSSRTLNVDYRTYRDRSPGINWTRGLHDTGGTPADGEETGRRIETGKRRERFRVRILLDEGRGRWYRKDGWVQGLKRVLRESGVDKERKKLKEMEF